MKRFLRTLFAFLILLEALSTFKLSAIASDFAWLGLVATAGLVWLLLELFDAAPFVWILALIATMLDAASALLLLYSRINPWDLIIHAVGGIVIAAGALELVLRNMRKGYLQISRYRTAFVAMSVLMTVAFVGLFYEVLEYLVDRLHYGYLKSLVGAYDSIEDQLFNLLGGVMVLGVYYAWQWRKRWREEK